MPSIAQIILDKFNGVETDVQSASTAAESREVDSKKAVQAPLTESEERAKTALQNALRKGIWMIDYNKVDGTPATMECTLDEQYIPRAPQGSSIDSNRSKPAHLLAVYATDRAGWRSFAIRNVKKIYKKVDNL